MGDLAMYYMIVNGFSLDMHEALIKEFLRTLNPNCRIFIKKGLNGADYGFESVKECLDKFHTIK